MPILPSSLTSGGRYGTYRGPVTRHVRRGQAGPWGREAGGPAGPTPTPTPTRLDPPGARAWRARPRSQRPGGAASARSKFVSALRGPACTGGPRSWARVCASVPQCDLETSGVRRDRRSSIVGEDGLEQVARFCNENFQALGGGRHCRLT